MAKILLKHSSSFQRYLGHFSSILSILELILKVEDTGNRTHTSNLAYPWSLPMQPWQSLHSKDLMHLYLIWSSRGWCWLLKWMFQQYLNHFSSVLDFQPYLWLRRWTNWLVVWEEVPIKKSNYFSMCQCLQVANFHVYIFIFFKLDCKSICSPSQSSTSLSRAAKSRSAISFQSFNLL